MFLVCFFSSFNDFNSSSGSVFLYVHANIDNDADCLKVIITPLQKISDYFFFHRQFFSCKFGLITEVT